MTADPIAAARAMIVDAIDFACAANQRLAGQDPEQAQQWMDALSTLADALEAERTEREQAESAETEYRRKNYRLMVEMDQAHAAAEAERKRAEKAETSRDEWKDEYQAAARLLKLYKDASVNWQIERDLALARVAAAYEAAAKLSEASAERNKTCPSGCRCADGWHIAMRIRALTPADAQAALDKLLAKARLEGWRAALDAASNVLSTMLEREDAETMANHER